MALLHDLPSEILHRVFATLPTSALLSLARPSTLLNTFAEVYLWRSIDLLTPQDPEGSDDPADEVNIVMARHRLDLVLTHIPGRTQHVRSLKIQLTKDNVQDLLRLTRMVIDTVVDLEVQVAFTRLLWDRHERQNATDTFARSIGSDRLVFGAVKRLTMTLSRDSQHVFSTLVSACPWLKHLTLTRLPPTSSAPSLPSPLAPDCLPSLVSLTVDQVISEYVPLILQLLQSPCLKHMGIFASPTVSKRLWWIDIQTALQNKQGLESLSSFPLGIPADSDAFVSIRRLCLGVLWNGCYAGLLEVRLPRGRAQRS